jgi:hypothetical protein
MTSHCHEAVNKAKSTGTAERCAARERPAANNREDLKVENKFNEGTAVIAAVSVSALTAMLLSTLVLALFSALAA